MGETFVTGLDVVSLPAFEVLAEVLVTAPPVEVNHTQTFDTETLMEVRVANVVLFAISRHTTLSDTVGVPGVSLSEMPSPVLDHLLLLVLNQSVEYERLVKVEAEGNPDEADSVLLVERVHLPVDVAEGVFEEARDVLERSVFLCLINRFLGVTNKLHEVTVSFLGKGSKVKLLSPNSFI